MNDREAQLAEFVFLEYLSHEGPGTFTQDSFAKFSRQLNVTPETLAEAVLALHNQELISIARKENDALEMGVTEKGGQLLQKRQLEFAAKCEAERKAKIEARRQRWIAFWQYFNVFGSNHPPAQSPARQKADPNSSTRQ